MDLKSLLECWEGELMNSILIGNGINIQYGGTDNLNKEIILRAIKGLHDESYPTHIIIDEPELIEMLFGLLFLEVRLVLNHKYDQYAFSTDEKRALANFIYRYENKKSITLFDIGFEDYYLIFELFSYKNGLENPDRYTIRETFKRNFIYSIFNKGKVNDIYKKFPLALKHFLNGYDTIFTTNYDRNLELFLNKDVYYLHGAFHIKDNVYDPNSLRNKLPDKPLENIEIDEKHYYLYSNVLTDFSGGGKLFAANMYAQANRVIDQFSNGDVNNSKIKQNIDEWENSENALIKNFHDAIKLKIEQPEVKMVENYPINEFKSIEDKISILGLSPNNDTHLFKLISENESINEVEYYYFDNSEIKEIESLFPSKNIHFESVKELWNSLGSDTK